MNYFQKNGGYQNWRKGVLGSRVFLSFRRSIVASSSIFIVHGYEQVHGRAHGPGVYAREGAIIKSVIFGLMRKIAKEGVCFSAHGVSTQSRD